jgi:GNAT superfamily N-acetyltransferase
MTTILRAIPEQAETLTAIAIAAKRHWNYPEKWIQIWLPLLTVTADYIRENETWAAVQNERRIAYYSLKNDGGFLWLDNLWVLPEFMGQGIGRDLFQHALERSRTLGASTLKIEADPNAQSFYEKMGARKIGEHQTEVDGQPRVLHVMEINLQFFPT